MLILQALEIPIFYENFDDGEASPECEFIPRSLPKPTELGDNDKKVCLLVAKVFLELKFYL